MTSIRVIGLDPGPIPGLVRLNYLDGRLLSHEVVQCSASALLPILSLFLETSGEETYFAWERFVVGRKSMRGGAAGHLTRDQIGQANSTVAAINQVRWARGRPALIYRAERSASEVMPWATDERLVKAGLYAATKGMQHARAAARHALYSAVADGRVPDPLSKKARPLT